MAVKVQYGCLFCNYVAPNIGCLNSRHLNNYDPNRELIGKINGDLQTDPWHECSIISAARWKDVGRWADPKDIMTMQAPTSHVMIALSKKIWVKLEGDDEIYKFQGRHYRKVSARWWQKEIKLLELIDEEDLEDAIDEVIDRALELTRPVLTRPVLTHVVALSMRARILLIL